MDHKIYAAEVNRPMGTTAVLVVTTRRDEGIVHDVFVDSILQGQTDTPEGIVALIATSLPAAVTAKADAMPPPPYARITRVGNVFPTPAELVNRWPEGAASLPDDE